MEVIKNYLESMFRNLPQNEEMKKIKEDLYNTMEDKYMEFKAAGHSENTAIGMVISNFGNIDELLAELGLNTAQNSNTTTRSINLTEAQAIVRDKKMWGKIIGIGISICIMAPAVLIFLSGLMNHSNGKSIDNVGRMFRAETFVENGTTSLISLMAFFTCIAIGVAILIVSGMMNEKYQFLEKEIFDVSISAKTFVQQEKNRFQLPYTISITLAIMLCILSPMVLISISVLGNSQMGDKAGVSTLILLIAIAVYIFVSTGTEMSTYKQLLQVEDYRPENKKENKVVSAVAAVIWPLVVVVYLVWSFKTGDWGFTWIIWPITGILFGGFSAVVNIITGKEA